MLDADAEKLQRCSAFFRQFSVIESAAAAALAQQCGSGSSNLH